MKLERNLMPSCQWHWVWTPSLSPASWPVARCGCSSTTALSWWFRKESPASPTPPPQTGGSPGARRDGVTRSPDWDVKTASSPSLSSSSSSSRQVPEEREASGDRQGEAALLLHHPGPVGQLHGAPPPSLTTGFTPPDLKSRTLVCPRPVLCLCKYFFCWLFFLHVHKTIIMKI